MNTIGLAENIIRLRREKKLTQQMLASVVGVTKASVSKWECGQSMPDILLLPRLASFFGVSIDELIGYKPQLPREQIQKIYFDFTAEFASKPFDEVMQKVRETVMQYYSCYPLLLQICVLYMNHAPLAASAEEVRSILCEARELCVHIISDCSEAAIVSDAVFAKSVFDLQLGDTKEVIASLEPITSPTRMSGQPEALLIQAYLTEGVHDRAMEFIQISIYLHLLSLVGISAYYLASGIGGSTGCRSTINRVDDLARIYRLDSLHPNVMAQFNYQSAITCIQLGECEAALARLSLYAQNVLSLLDENGCALHGDEYFDRLDTYISSLALGSGPPRDKSFIRQNALLSLASPVFAPLYDSAEYKAVKKRIEEATVC